MKSLPVYLPDELHAQLRQVAFDRRETMSAIAVQAIAAYLTLGRDPDSTEAVVDKTRLEPIMARADQLIASAAAVTLSPEGQLLLAIASVLAELVRQALTEDGL